MEYKQRRDKRRNVNSLSRPSQIWFEFSTPYSLSAPFSHHTTMRWWNMNITFFSTHFLCCSPNEHMKKSKSSSAQLEWIGKEESNPCIKLQHDVSFRSSIVIKENLWPSNNLLPRPMICSVGSRWALFPNHLPPKKVQKNSTSLSAHPQLLCFTFIFF